MNRSSKLTLAIALALGSSNALALGLGNIEVRSGLNEPLVADIPIVESDSGEGADLRANLASIDDFNRVGLDVSAVTVPLSFEVLKDRDGRSYLHVTSDDPVREPFLSFLVEVSWGRGRLLREYNVLLDPPAVAPAVIGSNTVVEALPEPEPAPAQPLEPAMEPPVSEAPAEPVVEPLPEPVTEPVVEESTPIEPVAEPVEPTPEPVESVVETPVEPEPTPEPMVSEPAPEPEPAPIMETPVEPVAEQPTSVAPSEYGPVATGETLWDIASSTRHDAVSMNQMMLAILRANPDSFIDSNVNYLRRGAVLRIPSSEEAQAIAAAEAAAEVAAQMDTWRASRAPTFIADTGSAGSTSSANSGDDSSSNARLALVPPREGSGSDSGLDRPGQPGGTDTSGLRNDLTRTQEQLASREQEVTELRSRVGELEDLRSQSDRLITLKDNEIAALQQRLREAEAKAAEERAARDAAQAAVDQAAIAAAVTESTTPVVDTSATTTTEPVATTPTDSATPTDTGAATTGTEEPAASIDPLAEQIEAEAASGPESTATVADTDIPATDGTAEVTPVPEATPIAEAPAEAPPATTADTSAVTDASGERPALPWYRNTKILIGGSAGLIVLGALLALMGRRKAKPVMDDEPRSSVADQFAGGVFGARAAASGDSEEGALLERLAADPTDLDSHLDLLRLYHHSADVEKFESAANAMYAQVGDTSHPAWQQAIALGAEMLPDNPLFQAQDFAADGGAFDMSSTPSSMPAASSASAAVKPGDSGLFDFDIDRKPASSTAASAPAKPAAGADFDFSLDVPEVKKPSAADVGATAKVAKPEAQSFTTQEFKAPDFDLDLSKPEPAKMTAKPAPAPAAPAAAPDNFFEGEDAVGTKLDLARAYLDMGDPEGARSMLQEVLGEGTDAQKTEARKLLSEIG